MSVRTIREEIFLVETREQADVGPTWTYRSRHRTAQAAHQARTAAVRLLGYDARRVRVVRMTIVTTTEVLVNQKKEKAS